MKNNLGKIHVYTGDGKGKTTSSFGLALRAAGAGYRVCIIQFMKGQDYSELKLLKSLPRVSFQRFGPKTFVIKKGKAEDFKQAKKGLAYAKKVLTSKKYDLVILDEVLVAVFFKLIAERDLIALIKHKPTKTELVLTGRRATPKIMALADYVTEMREIKHPYQKGILARQGIEN
ncbi:MAG: cob(I)yrinic acid a,c-diamide adenosyltransferase [Patescibacteria group bacterium]|nr:cob(I)yrinic acid a,c-diamide adenosyltransferase [Patescibacteria group bacterium]